MDLPSSWCRGGEIQLLSHGQVAGTGRSACCRSGPLKDAGGQELANPGQGTHRCCGHALTLSHAVRFPAVRQNVVLCVLLEAAEGGSTQGGRQHFGFAVRGVHLIFIGLGYDAKASPAHLFCVALGGNHGWTIKFTVGHRTCPVVIHEAILLLQESFLVQSHLWHLCISLEQSESSHVLMVFHNLRLLQFQVASIHFKLFEVETTTVKLDR